jgi:heme exporter protein B
MERIVLDDSIVYLCNAVAKSFLQESKGRMLYFYTIAGAKDFIISKLFSVRH